LANEVGGRSCDVMGDFDGHASGSSGDDSHGVGGVGVSCQRENNCWGGVRVFP
jgi:hypothetical protein